MKAEEFVIWLRGFIAGSNHFNLTPAGWDKLKEEAEKVKLSAEDTLQEGGDGIDDLLD